MFPYPVTSPQVCIAYYVTLYRQAVQYNTGEDNLVVGYLDLIILVLSSTLYLFHVE